MDRPLLFPLLLFHVLFLGGLNLSFFIPPSLPNVLSSCNSTSELLVTNIYGQAVLVGNVP